MSNQTGMSVGSSISDIFLQKEMVLVDKLTKICYGPTVDYIYNPLSYALDIHNEYLRKFCNGPKKLLFLGMNPGPWGMMQNGVPFGESCSVLNFLKLTGSVKKPSREHPARPVLGLSCTRSEVSGKRFWALASALGAGSSQEFFKHSFVHNYFPLCLLNSNGKNVTPAELKADILKEVEQACDESLLEILLLLKVEVIVAIGRFAEKKAQKLRESNNLPIKIIFISHPSPRNPASNRDWLNESKTLIVDSDLAQYFAI